MTTARELLPVLSAMDGRRYEDVVLRARRALLHRDFAAARAELEHAVGEDDRRPEAFNLLGVIEALRGDHGRARGYWRMALALSPGYEPAEENLLRVALRPRIPGGLALG